MAKEKTYYAIGARASVAMPLFEKDENGLAVLKGGKKALVYKQNEVGGRKAQNGKFLFEKKILKFLPSPGTKVNGELLEFCYYQTDQWDEVEYLDALAKNPRSPIKSKEAFEDIVSPVAAKAERRAAVAEKALAEKDDIIARQEKMLEELKKNKK